MTDWPNTKPEAEATLRRILADITQQLRDALVIYHPEVTAIDRALDLLMDRAKPGS